MNEAQSHLLAVQLENEGIRQTADYRRGLWAVVLGLIPKRDGDKWFVLCGGNLQEGIAAFGDTPEEAIVNFDEAMRSVVDPLIEANKEREYQRKSQDMDNPTDMTRSRDRQALALDRARLAALAAKEK